MGRTSQSCFKISVTPVNSSVDQIWFFGQHRFHRGEISVSGNHEALHACSVELGMMLGEIRYVVS